MANHQWKFFRAGGVDQVTFRDGADIANLEQLDQKLWMALAIPTRGIEFDPKTADLIDTDKDGRIRPPELLGAVKWAQGAFKDLGGVVKGGESVALSAIKDEGILTGAKRILANLGKANADAITMADLADQAKIFVNTKFNGDGIVPADSASDDATKKAIEDIIATLGAVNDRSGKPGVNQPNVDAFFAQAAAFADWAAKGESDPALLPAGPDGTAAAAAAVKAVKAKVDDYFARCRLAAFDARALVAVNREEKEYLALGAKELTIGAPEIAAFPLTRIEAGKPLPLTVELNPAWAAAVAALTTQAVTPLLGAGRITLTEADWTALLAKLGPYECWTSAKPATAVEKLGLPRLRELIQSPAKDKIASLIKEDLSLEAEVAQIASVDKLVRFQRDLYELLTNSVNFADFYGRTGAVFQAGTLYLDARACGLCIEVADAGKHGTLAGLAGAYLAYCDITRPGGLKKTIVAVFTDGDSDNLMPGRNGVFYDRKGQDWDATITKLIANPISIRESFWLPYKKFVRLIEEQVAKRAAAADAASSDRMAKAASAVAAADKVKAPEPKKVDVGTVAALGVAFGAIGTFFTTMAAYAMGVVTLGPLAIVGALIGVILLISGPSMLLAWLKLRKRNLGPILDANGWAINTKARMNVPFGAALTQVAKLPAGSERTLDDPFAEKKRPWKLYITLAVLLLLGWYWYDGKLDNHLPASITSVRVLGDNAPAAKRTPKTAVAEPGGTNAAPASVAEPAK